MTSISLNQQSATLKVEKSLQLTATIVPSAAQNQSINWKSSNDEVAGVNQTGLVIAKSVGTATITAETVDGGHTAACEITVTEENSGDKPAGYKIILNPCGGTVEKTEMVTNKDGKLFELPTPTYNGYTFKGWYTAASKGDRVDEKTIFTQDTTIFAQWEQPSGGNGSSGGSSSSGGNGSSGGSSSSGGNVSTPSEPEQFPANLPFTDVPSSAWYAEAARYVYENGMMNGTSSSLFEPNGITSRAMIVTVLHRLEGGPDATASDFTDASSNMYYADAVAWAQANGIVNGTSATTFSPNDPIRQTILLLVNR